MRVERGRDCEKEKESQGEREYMRAEMSLERKEKMENSVYEGQL